MPFGLSTIGGMAAARTRTRLDARARSGAETPVRLSGRFRSLPEARPFVHALGLPSFAAWGRWATSPARPADIPSDPDRAYAQAGWTAGRTGWAPNIPEVGGPPTGAPVVHSRSAEPLSRARPGRRACTDERPPATDL